MKKTASKDSYDIAIVGAGVIGCAVARELARYQLKICLIDKENDVANGTTKANSGIIHGGYADEPGTLRAKLCCLGNTLYSKLAQELNFGLNRIGSWVLGFSEEDQKQLQVLLDYGIKNGVSDLEIMDKTTVLAKEPNLNQEIKSALYCPSAGVVSPYEVAIALAENAIQNGVALKLETEVSSIQKDQEGFLLKTNWGEFCSKIVINAAGLYADKLAEMVGTKNIVINPRRGQYLLFDKDAGQLVNSVIFQVPTKISKGVLVTKTQHGNLLLGPDAMAVAQKDDLDTEPENLEKIILAARKTLPNFELSKVITCFAGNRAATKNHDFIIEESEVSGFINVAGIESPGLTAAPAISKYVVELIDKTSKVKLVENPNFNPTREDFPKITELTCEQLDQLIKREPSYGKVICRCEEISLGEINAVFNRGIPIKSLDALKRRTRTGMGQCQGSFCTPRLIEIISKNLKVGQDKILKGADGSFMVCGPAKEQAEH